MLIDRLVASSETALARTTLQPGRIAIIRRTLWGLVHEVLCVLRERLARMRGVSGPAALGALAQFGMESAGMTKVTVSGYLEPVATAKEAETLCREQKRNLEQHMASYHAVMADLGGLERELAGLDRECQTLESKAMDAVRAGQDDMAKRILVTLRPVEERRNSLHETVLKVRATAQELEGLVETSKMHILRLEGGASALRAHAQRSKLDQAFAVLEERVQEAEQARASEVEVERAMRGL